MTSISAEIQGTQKLKDKFDKLINEGLDTEVWGVMQTAALEIERRAKEKCPVKTGALRASIGNPAAGGVYREDKEDLKIELGSALPYARRQEHDDTYEHPVGQAHFMRDAKDEVRPLVKDLILARVISTLKK